MDMPFMNQPASPAQAARSVRVFDTTLRDGEQTPGVHFTVDQKVAIAEQLDAIGVDTIEAGFPASSPGDAEAVRIVARTVRNAEVAALARAVPADVEAVVRATEDAGCPVVHIVLGASEIHLKAKLGITRADALRRAEDCVRIARRNVAEVQFSPEDASRAERPFLRQMVQAAVNAGATRINLPDTVGCASPYEYSALVADIARHVPPEVMVGAHCHDDLGLATANSVAAVEAGAAEVQVTVNGIGERAGNAALEEVVAVLRMKTAADCGVRMEDMRALSEYVASASGVAVQPNKPIVGAHAFAHSSGIHQAAILKDARTYAFVEPERVGVAGHRLVLTARSGRHAVAASARREGYALTPDEVDAVYAEFIRVADACPGAVPDATVRDIVARVVGREPVRG